MPLAATTRLEYDGLTGDLVADLDALASGRTPVLVLTRIEPTPPEDELEETRGGATEPQDEPETRPSTTPEPDAGAAARSSAPGSRSSCSVLPTRAKAWCCPAR